MSLTRRKYLAGMGGALLAATPLAAACTNDDNQNEAGGDTFYGHGMVWNRELPGVAGEVRLSFDLRVNLETGMGFGSAHDPVYPDWGLHFAINSLQRTKVEKGETRYEMEGVVTKANNPGNAGLPVRIAAQTLNDITAQLQGSSSLVMCDGSSRVLSTTSGRECAFGSSGTGGKERGGACYPDASG